MSDVQHFPFVEARDAFGDIDVVPRLPLRLGYRDRQTESSRLLDTGHSPELSGNNRSGYNQVSSPSHIFMLNVSDALQQAEFTTNATGQTVVQLNLTAWETINAAMQANTDDESEEDPVMMQLFLDFITTEALKSNTLQPYTIEQSAITHSLIAGVSIDHD